MTDPLLTIEDATREFRVSPKTIRRRLTSGEIAGAYKRPGNRGPEWVMPRRSLAEAGFVPRPSAAPATLPADAEERAAYWERRALDAEAALRSGEGSSTPRRRHGRALRWVAVGAGLLVALIVGLVVLDAADDATPASRTNGAMPLVAELLERETEPGDAIGLVGERRTDALPAGRVAAPSPRAGWASSSGPRFVVATFDDGAPPAPVRALRDAAEVVLRAPHARMVVEVYDRRSPGSDDTSAAPNPAPAASDPDDQTARPDSPAAEDPASASASEAEAAVPVAPTAPTERVPGPDRAATAPAVDAPVPTRQVQVAPGKSFWVIAVEVVAAELGADPSDPAVTSYWSALVRTNAGRLVVPGNPDLLHVGQTILLPPVT